MKYAADTSVPADRSRAEIERDLDRYGATSFMYGREADRALIMFVANGRRVRFLLPMPDRNSKDITHTPTGKARTATQQQVQYEQATRQRWRALALVVKAKLEAVETGIVTFDQEFGMHILLPNGRTVGEEILPNIDRALETGTMPELLPALEAGHG
jgi:hypothetical protein